MSIYAGPNTSQSGLVLHLDASNRKSYPGTGVTWFDLSGNNNNGTLVNGVSYEGTDAGGCLSLDGSNDYISCGTQGVAASTFSSETWIKKKSNSSAHFFIIDNFDQPELRLSFPAGGLFIQYYDNSSYFTNTTYTFSFNSNFWYHIVSTLQNGSQRYYINGNLVLSSSGSYNGNATTNAGEHTLGTYNRPSAGYNGYASVKYSVHKIYNRVLSPVEILQNYHATKGRYGL